MRGLIFLIGVVLLLFGVVALITAYPEGAISSPNCQMFSYSEECYPENYTQAYVRFGMAMAGLVVAITGAILEPKKKRKKRG